MSAAPRKGFVARLISLPFDKEVLKFLPVESQKLPAVIEQFIDGNDRVRIVVLGNGIQGSTPMRPLTNSGWKFSSSHGCLYIF